MIDVRLDILKLVSGCSHLNIKINRVHSSVADKQSVPVLETAPQRCPDTLQRLPLDGGGWVVPM